MKKTKEMYKYLKKILEKVIGKCLIKLYKVPSDCHIEGHSKIRNITCEGKNHIGAYCNVYNTYLGIGSGISRDSIIDRFFIGRYTTLGPDVKVIIGQHPTRDIVSTYPAFYSNRKQMGFSYTDKTIFNEFRFADDKQKYKVIIGNDVWIGSYTKIMEGVSIGDGAIVAAGALVTKDVAPYAIVGGVPAKLIRYRFEKDEIDFLLNLKWWNKDEEWLMEHIEFFANVKEMKEYVQIIEGGGRPE